MYLRSSKRTGKNIKVIYGMEAYVLVDEHYNSKGELDYKSAETYHAVILVRNQTGLKNLYRIVSESHLNYFYKRPRVPWSLFEKYREGLMIGTACEAGELYRAVRDNKPEKVIKEIAARYDYLEIQPIGNNQFMVREGIVKDEETLRDINRKIVELGERLGKPVVATCDVHFLDPDDAIFRQVLQAGQGYKDYDKQAPVYFRTTCEMLEEFSYLGEDKAFEVVVTNPNAISEMIEEVQPIPDGTYPPKLEDAEEEIKRISEERVRELYGDPLPELVRQRVDRELGSIIKNGFSSLYMIARKLVLKSLSDGYLVGSRGSVGSSFVAYLLGITEVNALPPHYRCGNCKYSEFYVKDEHIACGFDLPDKVCPRCGQPLIKDGHDIRFETFLGFDGDKEPDIDLNFSGEYQPRAHKYTEELFGVGYTFRAGTIATIAEKTAYGFAKKFLEERGIPATRAETERLAAGCMGTKRTTGQHPGGVMVVPKYKEIYDFTPIQRPADDPDSDIITTHFDYHSISGRILKLDILGHDDPTVIKMLQDLTGVDPKKIPLDDKKTMGIFSGTEPLGVTPEEIGSPVGTIGVPEFGTKFVRQMLEDTKPKTFAELIRISGLSHGTDVWLNNAQDLIRNGTTTLSGVIGTRDDIMIYLMSKDLPPLTAFKIMEAVRKGKGLSEEYENLMRKKGVPEWYIESCKKIKYLFPKAHAAAYVMMAFRIAWFKVYYPEAFYATYFSVRADTFDANIISRGPDAVNLAIKDIEEKGKTATQKDKDLLTILEVAREMYARGIKCLPVDLYKSDATRFTITGDGILPPLTALQGLGASAARNIADSRKYGEFVSIEDLKMRSGVSKAVIDILAEHGCLDGLEESSQLSMFA
jgi:DNA polymerase III catalytic subunit, PolC type